MRHIALRLKASNSTNNIRCALPVPVTLKLTSGVRLLSSSPTGGYTLDRETHFLVTPEQWLAHGLTIQLLTNESPVVDIICHPHLLLAEGIIYEVWPILAILDAISAKSSSPFWYCFAHWFCWSFQANRYLYWKCQTQPSKRARKSWTTSIGINRCHSSLQRLNGSSPYTTTKRETKGKIAWANYSSKSPLSITIKLIPSPRATTATIKK